MDPTDETPLVEMNTEEKSASNQYAGARVLSQSNIGSKESLLSSPFEYSLIDEMSDEKNYDKKAAIISGAVSNTGESSELEVILQELPRDERRIVQEQLDAPTVSVTFFVLYRYASTFDITIICVSSLCAIAGGAALPLFIVS